MSNDNLFRQALQRQNERAAGMKMPIDMEQRVMKKLVPKNTHRRWLYPLSAVAIAACLLLLILLKTGKPQPAVAEKSETPKSSVEKSPTDGAEKHDVPYEPTQRAAMDNTACHDDQNGVPRSETRWRAKKHPQPSAPAEPVPQAAEPIPEEPGHETDYLPQQPDLYLLAAAEAQDIRARGERLYQEVAQMMNNH
jgi:uncharacterized protein involved in copper resistance